MGGVVEKRKGGARVSEFFPKNPNLNKKKNVVFFSGGGGVGEGSRSGGGGAGVSEFNFTKNQNLKNVVFFCWGRRGWEGGGLDFFY